MSVWEKISEYLRGNITKNMKELMATVGSMILTLLTTIIFIMRSGYSLYEGLIVILIELQPFCYIYMKIIFSGQSNLKDQEILLLKQQLADIQELSEYKIKLAARDALIVANKEWSEINEAIANIEKKIL